MSSSHNFRSTSPAREALLSVSTAPPGSPPRLAPSAGLVVVQASRWAMADPEDEDDGQQATSQANKERRRGRYRRGEQAGSRPPARTASTLPPPDPTPADGWCSMSDCPGAAGS